MDRSSTRLVWLVLAVLPLAATIGLPAATPVLGAAPSPAPAGPAPKTPQSLANAQRLTAPVGQWPADGWWQGYGDAQLAALDAEDILITTRRTTAALKTSVFTLDVALVRALGGGFQA